MYGGKDPRHRKTKYFYLNNQTVSEHDAIQSLFAVLTTEVNELPMVNYMLKTGIQFTRNHGIEDIGVFHKRFI